MSASEEGIMQGRWPREFLKLWLGQAISGFGSSITSLALPLTAVTLLHASATEMGFLRASATFPALFMSLLLGVWVDRSRRRPLLIWSDLGRMLLLGVIPLLSLLGILNIFYLYIVSLLTGCLTVLFDIAVTSFLPSLVERKDLLRTNGQLALSGSVIAVIGPSAAGILIQWLTAPLAILVDAISFLVSVISLLLIQTPEVPLSLPKDEKRSVVREIGEGLQTLWNTTEIRAMTISSTIGSAALSIQQTVFVLYLVTVLHLSAIQLGVVLSSTGCAAILGAMLARPIAQGLGPGRAIIAGQSLTGLGTVCLACAGGPLPLALSFLIGGQILIGLGTPIYSTNQLSLRQMIIPDRLLGRVNASRRFLVFGIAPLAALLGGVLGSLVGLQATMSIGAAGMLLSALWAFCSPLRVRKELLQQGGAVANK